jgi:hypothetical protein
MLWTVDLHRRPGRLRLSRCRLKKLTASAAEFLRYGTAYFGGLETFSFQCPGPCGMLHVIRRGHRRRTFNRRTQRFRCPVCAIELQLSILAEVLPPRQSRRAARVYEARRLREMSEVPADHLPTVEQGTAIRRLHTSYPPEKPTEPF